MGKILKLQCTPGTSAIYNLLAPPEEKLLGYINRALAFTCCAIIVRQVDLFICFSCRFQKQTLTAGDGQPTEEADREGRVVSYSFLELRKTNQVQAQLW